MDNIVVGIDGSQHAQDALVWAWREAHSRGASLTLISAWDTLWFRSPSTLASAYEESSKQLVRDEQRILDAAVAYLRKDPRAQATEITTLHDHGPVVPTLLRLADSSSMIVVGRRGRGRLGRLMMGSVSAGVARDSVIPVTVVPAEWLPRKATSVTTGALSLQRAPDDVGLIDPGPVVVGVDGSPASIAALRHGIEVATRTRADLKAVACWQIASIGPLLESNGWAPPIEDYEIHMGLMLDDALKKVQDELVGLPPENLVRVIEHSLAAKGLLLHAANAQRLIVGHRGHGGFDRLLLGSVSSQVLEHASCPVTVVRG